MCQFVVALCIKVGKNVKDVTGVQALGQGSACVCVCVCACVW